MGEAGEGVLPSSRVPLACDRGCTVGPGAPDWPPGGGRAEGALVDGACDVGDTLCGYCLRAAPAAVLAALDDDDPMVFTHRVGASLLDVGENCLLPAVIIEITEQKSNSSA